MFKPLYSNVNNIIEKYLQIYNHILIKKKKLYVKFPKKSKNLV